MKKLLFGIVPFLALMAVMSCSKKDEGKAPAEVQEDDKKDGVATTIDGVWVYSEINVETKHDLNNDGEASNNLLNESDCFNEGELVLNENGTALLKNKVMKVVAKSENNKIIFEQECISLSDTPSTWSKKGNVITLVENQHQLSFDLNYVNNTLRFTLSKQFEYKLPDETPVSENMTYVFKKRNSI